MRIVIASGYFNPLHVGHIRYLEAAGRLGHQLIVIVNNNNQVRKKGSIPFMDEEDRKEIIAALRCVDRTYISIDNDKSVSKSIAGIASQYNGAEVIFAKGGDRTKDEIPEKTICRTCGVKIIDGVGGEKIRSSSEIVQRMKGG